MGILTLLCFALATVLAALAAANVPSARISLLAAAVAFLSLGFTIQAWGASGAR